MSGTYWQAWAYALSSSQKLINEPLAQGTNLTMCPVLDAPRNHHRDICDQAKHGNTHQDRQRLVTPGAEPVVSGGRRLRDEFTAAMTADLRLIPDQFRTVGASDMRFRRWPRFPGPGKVF